METAEIEKLAEEARALKDPIDVQLFTQKLIEQYGYSPMDASLFVAFERTKRDGSTTAPL
jgi:hypothetical protein